MVSLCPSPSSREFFIDPANFALQGLHIINPSDEARLLVTDNSLANPNVGWRISVRRSESHIPLPNPERTGLSRSTTSFLKPYSSLTLIRKRLKHLSDQRRWKWV